MKLNLKLILVILIALIVGGVIGNFVVKKAPEEEASLPALGPLFSSVYSKIDPYQFINGLYDKEQHLFKLSKDEPASLEATYYALMSSKLGIKTDQLSAKITKEIEGIFNQIRSYYNPQGYYEKKDLEPDILTRMILEIDNNYVLDLEQEISLDWLKNNSLQNQNLEPNKYDPEYQYNILGIYRNLRSDETREGLKEITPLYIDYYCDYDFAQIAEENYLRQKYYQISIISYLMNAKKLSANLCFKKGDVEFNKNKLSEIYFKDLDDIKEIYWLYYLQDFYNLPHSLREALSRIEEFYSGGGLKEKLNDEEPNLIGTYYGLLFFKNYGYISR